MIIDERNFTLGLDRVSSIIIGNPNYGDILGKRIVSIDFLETEDNYKRNALAVEYICSNFKKRGVKTYENSNSSDCLVFVKTKNNIKEFELFKSIVALRNNNVTYTNLAESKLVSFKLTEKEINLLMNEISDIFERYYHSKELNACILYQHYQYLCAYLDFLYTFSCEQSYKIHFTANDHSPIPVALTVICLKYNLSTIYFQHGSISRYFPELIFDLSVLHNQKSLDLYSLDNSRNIGKGFVLSRNLIEPLEKVLGKLKRIQEKSKNHVVIYLTAIFNKEELLDLVVSLKNDIYVESVYIKFHPSISSNHKNFILDILSISACETIPTFDHIAIIGNSSVLLELLSSGIPSLNCFALDSVENDYYGFVASGIATQMRIGDNIRDIVKLISYNSDFVNNVTKFNPSFSRNYRNVYDCVCDEISIYIGIMLNKQFNEYKNYFLENQMAKLIFCHTDEFRKITNMELIHLGFSIENMIIFLEDSFKNRNRKLIDVFNDVLLGGANNLLYIWLQMYKIEWTGFKPSLNHMDELLLKVFHIEKDIGKKVYKILENKLLNILIRYKYIEGIEKYFSSSNYVNINNLHINRRIALLKLLNDKNSNLDINLLYDGVSSYNMLKLEVQAIHKNDNLKINHHSLECEVVNLATKNLSEELKQYVIPVYDFLRKKMNFMDVSHNREEVKNLKSLIIGNIQSSTPFCFTRLSDGEGYIFFKQQSFMTLDDIKNRERHWWGCELNSDMREEIIDSLAMSLYNVDLIGIPTIYRFIRDSVDKTESLLGYLQGRGMYNVLQGLHNSSSMYNLNFVGSDKVNLSLLTQEEDFVELMRIAKHTVFITSVKKSVLDSKFDSDLNVSYIELPTHFKTSRNGLYNTNSEPLPFVYKEILKEIDKTIEKGSLVFVAGGIIGKIFIERCKQNGGIAIDVGSAIDMLVDAGIHSLH